MAASAVRTTCPYCGVGCGIIAKAFGEVNEVSGDDQHPANRGRLCSKAVQLGATLHQPGRLLSPRIDGANVSWNEALDAVANRFAEFIEKHGPDAVAFYVSGQLLTEDYYVANKLMKGAIGSANIDTNSRLCMASSVVGYKRAFGSDTVPCGYDDVEQADLVVLVGSNLAWCHPVLYERLHSARQKASGPTLVVIDPRRTPTAGDADLHLPVRVGMDSVLFNGLLTWLDEHGATDSQFLKESAEGYAEAVLAARSCRLLPDIAERCGINIADIEAFYKLFAATDRTVTIFSQGVNQSSVGSDKVNAIINVHLATGRIGRPGAGPFSITGQPNAMGGREVGGLANQLAAHMGFEPDSIDRVRRFWGFDRIATKPGLQAVALFDAIAAGDVKGVWIMGTNPAVSMPRANAVREALGACEFVVVSDCVAETDTSTYADVLLPALGWGEKDGTVTNSERCISRQRAFLGAGGEARPDWWIMSQVAARMGFGDQFTYAGSAAIFREHAALSAFENNGSRAFDIGELSDIDDAGYDHLQPTYWPCAKDGSRTARAGDIFSEQRFFTQSGKAQFVAVQSSGTAEITDDAYPLLLNSGRVRDQWHTMTRTAKAPRLNRHTAEPLLSLHPLDARRFGVADNQIADVRSRHGRAQFRVQITRSVRPGEGFVPMHWSDTFASASRVGSLIGGACDPHSGQPEFKAEPVAVLPADVQWHGLMLMRSQQSANLQEVAASYRVTTRFDQCDVTFLGISVDVDDWSARALSAMPHLDQTLTFDSGDAGVIVAGLSEERLQGLIIISRQPRNRDAGWLADFFAEAPLSTASKQALLRGLPNRIEVGASCGETLCACYGTSRGAVVEAGRSHGMNTTEAIGAALNAGSNCGSCLPEIREILDDK
jgi:assimilatory nitrate reductase catalytic subunit